MAGQARNGVKLSLYNGMERAQRRAATLIIAVRIRNEYKLPNNVPNDVKLSRQDCMERRQRR